MTYFNIRTNYGIETVDQLDRKDFPTVREYMKEIRRVLREYHLSGMNVYRSSRSTKDWGESK